MARTLEFLFDFGSPTAWLAWSRLPGVVARTGATLALTPILLGGVFKATGNRPPGAVAAKSRWMGEDMAMWAAEHRVPLAMNPHFPVNTLAVMRGAAGLKLRGDDRLTAYCEACFRGMWVDRRDMAAPDQIAAALEGVMDAGEFAALTADPAVKAALKDATEAAVARGVFGAPTVFVGERMFFGQDRLDWAEKALAA